MNELKLVPVAPMGTPTDREAALRAVVEAARGKMSDAEWVIAGREPLTAYRIYADAILAAGVSSASQPVQVEVTAEIGTKIAELSEWIDDSYPESLIGTELHVRRRVDKLMEESGEVGQAVGGWFGENPRKGVTHTRTDVLAELLDVAVTALGAYESLTGNAGSSIPALDAKLNMILERAGLSAALGGGE